MVTSCAAFNCTNRLRKGSGISFHKFPLNKPERLSKWLVAVKRDKFVPTYSHRLCSVHFSEASFWKSQGNKILKDDAEPTLFDFPDHLRKTEKVPRRILKRKLDFGGTQQNNTIDPSPCSSSVSTVTQCISSEHNYCSAESPTKQIKSLSERLEIKNKQIAALKKEKARSKQQCDRHRIQISDLKNLTKELKDQKINEHTLEIINTNFSEVIFEIIKRSAGARTSEYSDTLKKFALTLHFYSPVAYEYVRQSFNMSLPHRNTLRKWRNSLSGDPGFTPEAFIALEEQVSLSQDPIFVSLTFGEMSIKRCIECDGRGSTGYVDMGEGICVSEIEEAKEVLVLMVVAINASWKIPVGYFLINGLNADVRMNIISECISRLQDCKVTVVSVVCDGLRSNIVMGSKLDCNFQADRVDTSFQVGGSVVQMMFDACHMVKLMRNLFGDMKVLRDQDDNVIEWRYVELLEELQSKGSLTLANKVTKHHIFFKSQKMKVRLAVQVLSASVGNALLFLCNDLKLKEFQGAEATAKFCLFFDRLYDIMNSKNPLAKGQKSVLNSKNTELTFAFLECAEVYLLGLKDKEGRPLYQLPRKTAIIGFLSLCRGIKNMYVALVESCKLSYLATYKFSQDHIEIFFCMVRSRLGYNNNPSAQQFKAAYKCLLIANDVSSKITGNCVEENVKTKLLVWDGMKKANVMSSSEDQYHQSYDHRRRFDQLDPPPPFDGYSPILFSSSAVSEYSENVIVYIAGFIVRQISDRVYCDKCKEALYGDETVIHLAFLRRKNNGGLVIPSPDVIKICRHCEVAIRQVWKEAGGRPPKGPVALIIKKMVLQQFNVSSLFPQLQDHILENEFLDNHVLRIITLTVEMYMKVRFHHAAKTYSVSLHKKIVRQHLTKSIHFMNQ